MTLLRSVTVREAREWVTLATTVLLYGVFFFGTVTGLVRGPSQVGLLISIVLVQVACLIVAEIALSAWKEKPDERDAIIALKSYRAGYFVLMGCMSSVALAYVAWGGVASMAEEQGGQLQGPSVTLVGNALLLSFVLAEAAKSAMQIVLFRRSARGATG